jgi:hypothetical protein
MEYYSAIKRNKTTDICYPIIQIKKKTLTKDSIYNRRSKEDKPIEMENISMVAQGQG